MKTVTVYCASSSKVAEVYVEHARRLGVAIASRGWSCVNGAGNRGLMAEVSNAVLSSGGRVTGVIPRFMVDEGWFHPSLSELIVTETMHSRKQIMAERSDGCIALPGGIGTLEELMEVITWKQLGLYKKPVVILNINGYYDDLLKMLGKAVAENFMHLRHKEIYQSTSSIEKALEIIELAGEWMENPRSIAAL